MKKLKRLLTSICTVALAIAMVVGTTGLSAFAVTGGGEDVAEYKLNANIASSVVYGESFAVGAVEGYELTVTDPSGELVDATTGTVTANQLGNYVVTYTKGDLAYTFKVNSKMDEAYELYVGEVDNNLFYSAADIPTYAKTGKEYKIPTAFVGVTDENGVITVVKEVEPAFSGVKATKGANGYSFAEAGSVFVRYQTTVGNGANVLVKDYEIKVQKDLDDKKVPTISVTNFPTSGQLNGKVTLSTATVSDDYDKLVKVEISVLDPNGKAVTAAKVNAETGYAESYGDDVLYFDNAAGMTYAKDGAESYKGMYFYPQTKGDYKVTYKAVDDQGNAAKVLEYKIAVSDGRAPTIQYDADTIPTNWGWSTVTNAKEEVLESNKIHFGMPTFYDNDSAKEDIKVTLTITDPNGKTVVRFDDITKEAGRKYTSSNSVFTTQKEYVFTEEGFDFDIKAYVEAIKAATAENGTSYTVTGNYSVVYTAKDKTGNTASTSTYYINVVENYVDDQAPVVNIENAPARIVLKEGNEFTVPTASFYSEEDSKLTTTYKLVSGEAEIEVEGKEVLTFAEGKLGELEITTATVKLVATAKSDAGNETVKEIEIPVVNATAKEMNYTVVPVFTNETLYNGVGEINYGTIKIGDVPAEEVKNVGVELGIKDAEGAYLSQFSAEIYWADNTKIVRNITFVPSKEGTYYLEVRVFDIYGNNSVRMYPIEIQKKQETGSIESGASAGTLATEADVYETVELVNKSFKLENVGTYLDETEQANVYVATSHTISGGRFSLMGEELVMMTAGTFKVTDKPVIVTKADYTADYVGTKEGYEAWLASYEIEKKSIVANQHTDITFEVVGEEVPAYAEKVGEKVILPAMIAYNKVENAAKKDITVEVTHSSGTTSKVTTEADGTYSFVPNTNGTYTVTYTAVVGGSSETATYTLKVGDITAPEFSVEKHATTAKVGDSFKFKVISCDETNATYLKTLSKDGSTLNTVKTKTGTGDNIKFDKAGTYEVKYEVTDSNGNTATKIFTITVTEASANTVDPITVVSIVLIVLACALIAGIVVYLLISRKKTAKK